jgi:hypothetical protein
MTTRSETIRTGLPALVAETPLAPQPPALVAFGRGGGGKPRAAWFDVADGEAATAAATAMQLRTLPLTDDVGRDLADRLARGRVLPSGRALVPFVKRELYTQLVALAGEGAGSSIGESRPADPRPNDDLSTASPSREAEIVLPSAGATEGMEAEPSADAVEAMPTITNPPDKKPNVSRPGDRTFVGSPQPADRGEIGLGSVVLANEGPAEGWWEAEVIGINGSVFSLRWRDYPTEPTILRKAGELALLPPGEA